MKDESMTSIKILEKTYLQSNSVTKHTWSHSIEKLYQVGKYSLPDAKFKFMHDVYNKHDKWIEPKMSKPLSERILIR
jgi:hypothetical protein